MGVFVCRKGGRMQMGFFSRHAKHAAPDDPFGRYQVRGGSQIAESVIQPPLLVYGPDPQLTQIWPILHPYIVRSMIRLMISDCTNMANHSMADVGKNMRVTYIG